MEVLKIVGQYLIEAGLKILDGTCSMSLEEINKLALTVMHKELNKNEAADLLNISTRTFDRKVKNGELPLGLRERGSKSLIWYEDELVLKNYEDD